MNWQDFLLEPACDQVPLRSGFAAAFGVPLDRVAVVDSIQEAPTGMLVLAERYPVRGDFLCQLSVYAFEQARDREPLQTIGQLCAALGIRALVPDLSADPYAMILVDPIAGVREVGIDARRLDDFNEYYLVCESGS